MTRDSREGIVADFQSGPQRRDLWAGASIAQDISTNGRRKKATARRVNLASENRPVGATDQPSQDADNLPHAFTHMYLDSRYVVLRVTGRQWHDQPCMSCRHSIEGTR